MEVLDLKYYKNWEELKKQRPDCADEHEALYKENMQPYEEELFAFVINLLY